MKIHGDLEEVLYVAVAMTMDADVTRSDFVYLNVYDSDLDTRLRELRQEQTRQTLCHDYVTNYVRQSNIYKNMWA